MNYPVFFGLLASLLITSIVIGKLAAVSGKTASSEEYFLSGRKLEFLPLTLIFLATQLGSGVILGCSEAAFLHGWHAVYYALGISMGLVVLSLGLGARFRKLQVTTMPEIFTVAYQSTWLRTGAAIVFIIAMLGILLATGVATRKLFYALDLNDLVFIGFWAAVILYTTSGGLQALAKTESLQISFVLLTFIAVFVAIFLNNDVTTILSQININNNDITIPWSSWLIMPMLFTIIGQDMGQRCFAARTPEIVSKASIAAAILLSLSALLPIALGILAAHYNITGAGASVLLSLLQQLVHPVVVSVFACAILMAIVSTADSLLCAVSSNITLDLLEQHTRIPTKNLARIVTAVAGISVILLSYFSESIIGTMVLAYSVAVCALLVPLLQAVFAKVPNKLAAQMAFIIGLISFVILYILKIKYAELSSIALSYVGYLVFDCKKNKTINIEYKKANIISRNNHNISRKNMSRNLVKVLYKLQDSGYEAFLVGGAVRDLLLQGKPKDFDVATNATPEQVRKVFRNCRIIGRRFRLAHVHFGREIIEVATFRGGDNSNNLTSATGIILRDNVYGTLEQDALRRDFTINALYYTVDNFSIVDYADGMQDMANKQIRIIGDAATRYREDPVRMLRAIRFASKLKFAIVKTTAEPIYSMGELLVHMPPARLFDEFVKLFLTGHAVVSLEQLRQYKLLQYLLPQADNLLSNNSVEKFIIVALANTDLRVNDEQPVAPAFVLAAFLWQSFVNKHKSLLALAAEGQHDALLEAANAVLQQQRQLFSMPRYIADAVKDIWILQLRLAKVAKNNNRARRLSKHPKFRAAYDFLVLRASSGEKIAQELVARWRLYQ